MSGLTPGRSYQVELWSFDTGSPGNRVSDWSINGEPVADDYTFDGSVLPQTNEQYRMIGVVAADTAGRLRIEARRETSSTSYGVFLNALRISPASLDAELRTDTQEAMLERNASLYARLPFVLADAASITNCTLRIRYDDGFAAWLNGTEIARRNAPPTLDWDSAATTARPDGAVLVFEEIPVPPALLVEGANLLAVQGLNVAASDADFFLHPVLETRAPTGSSSVRFFPMPTPGKDNGSGAAGLVADIEFSVDHGARTNSFESAIACATPGAQVRYTLDGREPTVATGSPYTGPIPIADTTVVRAAHFGPAGSRLRR